MESFIGYSAKRRELGLDTRLFSFALLDRRVQTWVLAYDWRMGVRDHKSPLLARDKHGSASMDLYGCFYKSVVLFLGPYMRDPGILGPY